MKFIVEKEEQLDSKAVATVVQAFAVPASKQTEFVEKLQKNLKVGTYNTFWTELPKEVFTGIIHEESEKMKIVSNTPAEDNTLVMKFLSKKLRSIAWYIKKYPRIESSIREHVSTSTAEEQDTLEEQASTLGAEFLSERPRSLAWHIEQYLQVDPSLSMQEQDFEMLCPECLRNYVDEFIEANYTSTSEDRTEVHSLLGTAKGGIPVIHKHEDFTFVVVVRPQHLNAVVFFDGTVGYLGDTSVEVLGGVPRELKEKLVYTLAVLEVLDEPQVDMQDEPQDEPQVDMQDDNQVIRIVDEMNHVCDLLNGAPAIKAILYCLEQEGCKISKGVIASCGVPRSFKVLFRGYLSPTIGFAQDKGIEDLGKWFVRTFLEGGK